MQARLWTLLGFAFPLALYAAPPPTELTVTKSNNVKTVVWPRPSIPALATNTLLISSNLPNFVEAPAGSVAVSIPGYAYTTTNALPQQFYGLRLSQMSSNALLTANVLNRLAYGPTPDDLERVLSDPQAYIDDQLNMGTVQESIDVTPPDVMQTTNSVPPAAQVKTNWVNITVGGTLTATNLYLYLTNAGEAYIDDLGLYAGTGTNVDYSTNFIRNGNFESPLSGPWTVSPNLANSTISPNIKCSGNGSLHVVATSGGTTLASAIWQPVLTSMTNGQRCTLSYWYLPRGDSSNITVRLSNNGIVAVPTNEPPVTTPTWLYGTFTGRASSTTLYIYLDQPGLAYIDDIKLVAGNVGGAGPNLLQNGDFESPFPGSAWIVASNAVASSLSTTVAHSGSGSLKLEFSDGGTTAGSAIIQTNLPLNLNSNYTLSFWYVPSARGRLIVRLSGSGIRSEPDSTVPGLYRRLTLLPESASLEDLRAWFCHHAVEANRQLLEVLSQFWENHFVTYHSKSADYLDQYYDDFDLMNRLAAHMEFRELNRWRNAMLNPQCRFYDLLRVSAESPAMIIYLDTVGSRGDGSNIANENYARELLELFAMGVDNGYEQNDIVALSRAWTGWTVRLVDAVNEGKPFALQSTKLRVLDGNTSISNLVGVWSFVFRSDRHGTNRYPIFSVWSTNSTPTHLISLGPKIVPARFGSPWAGLPYQLTLPARAGTNGLQDGYDVIAHLADLPMTMEYISVKLCRLFVHDGFPNPTTRTNLPEYAFYDYTKPNLSPEAQLVHDCMLAWWNSNPRGQLRPVLTTIFNSELFRSHGGSMQKVKTPLEFVASAVRALRSVNPDGTATARTDGYAFTPPLSRMGAMGLFNRADPDGYPEAGPPWISAGTLAERLKYVQSLCIKSGDTGHGGTYDDAGASVSDPVALLKKKLPPAHWNDAGAVADYFLSILYPGEGQANLDLYRQSAVSFLNTLNDGSPAPTNQRFNALSNIGNAYDQRVRGMAAFLMTLQRFQEQ